MVDGVPAAIKENVSPEEAESIKEKLVAYRKEMEAQAMEANVEVMEKYNHKEIEVKWRGYWDKHPELFAAENDSKKEKRLLTSFS